MTKNTKKAVILTSCVIFLIVVLICLRFLPEKKDENDEDTQPISILTEPIDNINTINVVNSYGEYNFIKNKEKKLEIDGLTGFERNENSYDELNDKISELVAEQIVNSEVSNLNIYGLEEPESKIAIKYNNNSEIELFVGNQAPDEIGYYLMQKDKPKIYLVSKDSVEPFFKSKIDYISLSVTSPKSSKDSMKNLEYIELLSEPKNQEIKITKKKTKNKSIYNIVKPITKKVSKEGTSIIESIENIVAQKIESINLTQDDISKYGLDNPSGILNLKYKNEDVITIMVSKIQDSEDFFVKRSDRDVVYRVASYNLDWVDIDINKLIDSSKNNKS